MNFQKLSAAFSATLGKLGVACVLSGTVLYCPAAHGNTTETQRMTTETLAQKTLPGYLVNTDNPIKNPEIEKLILRGDLTEAIKQLRSASISASNTNATKRYEAEANRLEQLKREFSVAPEEMLKKIQARIPDATRADLDKWTAENELSWIPVDGEIRYFRREPGILLRLNKEAKARADAQEGGDPAAKSGSGFSFTDHLRAALDAAADQSTSIVLPMRYKVIHTVKVKPGKVPAGEKVRCWLPYPREDAPQQRDVKLIAMKPEGTIAADNETSQRTVYMEQPAASDGTATFSLEFEYTCSALVPDLNTARAQFTETERQQLQPFLAERKPHLLFTDDVTSLSRQIIKEANADTIVDKAYAIWSWIDTNIPWCPEMEYAVMPNIVDKVLAERRGDCGTQALTFIALSRVAGVPARWQSGWVMKPGGWNLHDWAEFYAPGIGWVPVDPSVGRQESDDLAVKEFLFGHMDSYRMIANSDHNAEFAPPKGYFRSDPVDNQRGELEWLRGNLGYDDWSYDVDVKILDQ